MSTMANHGFPHHFASNAESEFLAAASHHHKRTLSTSCVPRPIPQQKTDSAIERNREKYLFARRSSSGDGEFLPILSENEKEPPHSFSAKPLEDEDELIFATFQLKEMEAKHKSFLTIMAAEHPRAPHNSFDGK